MEINNHHLLIFLLFLTMLTTTSCNTTSSPSPSPSPSTPPPTSSSSSPVMQAINNIVNALIGSDDIPTTINKWIGILSMSNTNSNSNSNPNPLLTLTLFIPQQQDSTKPLDPFSFPYHIVPQRLTFSDLLLVPRNALLPTLLPGKSITVTDNSAANFSLNGVPLTHPDLYSTSSLSVHGVQTLLDYSPSPFGDPLAIPAARTPSPPTPTPFLPVGETWRSCAAASFASFSLFFFLCCFLQEFVFV